MKQYGFEDRLAFSQGTIQRTGMETIRALIPGCVSVEPVSLEADLKGTDYIAILGSGVSLNIDQKARSKGCSLYWTDGPDIALELWSSVPENGNSGAPGWTWDDKKETDYTLHTFDPADTTTVYLLPFQLLRKTFRSYGKTWQGKYRTAKQDSGGWRSKCVFVPANVVLDALREQMIGVAHAS